jgi:lysophospholipase L1-like esterase
VLALLSAFVLLASPASPVSAVVFYDENGNGRLDPGEKTRVPGVAVQLVGLEALSASRTGIAHLGDLPAGSYTVSVRSESLPPFFAFTAAPSFVAPTRSPVLVPLTLPIGSNRPNVYLAFGDSITDGEGSSDGAGYRGRLQALLRGALGAANLVNEGDAGAVSHHGARRIARVLEHHRPAYTLVLYGTNDWDETREGGEAPTMTINSLRRIVEQVRAASSLPFLATLIPTHVGHDPRATPERNRWVAQVNGLIRALAIDQGAVLVDLEAAFAAEPDPDRLYSDGLHPNDLGYGVIARAFFRAITAGATSAQQRLR